MSIKNKLYDLKLHDTIATDNGIEITRVPGGWIYHFLLRDTSMLVPYNNEFNSRHVENLAEVIQQKSLYK